MQLAIAVAMPFFFLALGIELMGILGGPLPIPDSSRATRRLRDVAVHASARRWSVVALLSAVCGTLILLIAGGMLDAVGRVLLVAVVIGTVAGLGGLLDRKAGAIPLELARLLAAAAPILWLARGSRWLVPIAAGDLAVCTGMGAWLLQNVAPNVRPQAQRTPVA